MTGHGPTDCESRSRTRQEAGDRSALIVHEPAAVDYD